MKKQRGGGDSRRERGGLFCTSLAWFWLTPGQLERQGHRRRRVPKAKACDSSWRMGDLLLWGGGPCWRWTWSQARAGWASELRVRRRWQAVEPLGCLNGFQVPGQGWECEVLGGGPAGGGAMAACLCEQVTCWTVLVWREHGVPVLATVRARRLAGTSTLSLPSAPSPGDAVGGAKYLCRCG